MVRCSRPTYNRPHSFYVLLLGHNFVWVFLGGAWFYYFSWLWSDLLYKVKIGRIGKGNDLERLGWEEEYGQNNLNFKVVLNSENIIKIFVYMSVWVSVCLYKGITQWVIMLPNNHDYQQKLHCQARKTSLKVKGWKQLKKQYRLLPLPWVDFQNLKVRSCCWRHHKLWPQDLEELSWNGQENLSPEN